MNELALIQGVKVHLTDYSNAMNSIVRSIETDKPSVLAFLNAHCCNVARSDPEYKRIMNSFDLVLPDGSGVNLARRLLGYKFYQNLHGTGFVPKILEYAASNQKKVFLLGSKPDVIEKVKRTVESSFAGINIVGSTHGYELERRRDEIHEFIRKTSPDIVLVAAGVPLQEKWIHHNKDRHNARLYVAVGGLFDFLSGNIPRAPKWMRRIGCEWVYRLVQEPARMWKRYLIGNVAFVLNVLIEAAIKSMRVKKCSK